MRCSLSADALFKAREAEEAIALINCLVFSTYDRLPLREASFLCRPPATTFLAILKPRVSHEVSSQGAFRQGLIASLMGDLLTTFITIHGLESD